MPEISNEWMWRVILSGGVVFHGQRRLFKWIPGAQRCKNCLAPLSGPGAVLTRLLGRGPFPRNPRFCNF